VSHDVLAACIFCGLRGVEQLMPAGIGGRHNDGASHRRRNGDETGAIDFAGQANSFYEAVAFVLR
jgi:hypothetical protein